jgi:predicted DNA binding CopG/RHH family protein
MLKKINKTKRLHIRLTNKEFDALKIRASNENTTVSKIVRTTLRLDTL